MVNILFMDGNGDVMANDVLRRMLFRDQAKSPGQTVDGWAQMIRRQSVVSI